MSQQIKILRSIKISRQIKNDMKNLSDPNRSFSSIGCLVNNSGTNKGVGDGARLTNPSEIFAQFC